MYKKTYFFKLSLCTLLISCSTSKDKFFNKRYHNLNSKYNVIFNAEQALNFGEQLIKENPEQDFGKIIDVEPLGKFDKNSERSQGIPSFTLAEKKATKAIQKHSMNFNGKQKNSQIQRAYFILGKARYFDLRFSPAIDAFEYIMRIYDDKEIFLKAKLWKEKSNIRLNNNQVAIKNLKLLLSETVKFREIYSEINASIAHAFLNIKQQDSARIYISNASRYSKNNEKKARYSFIHGQLLEKINLLDSAQKVYQSILDLGRKTPRLFWIHSKLNFLKIQISKSQINPIPTTRKLKKNYENFPYLHLIDQFEARYYINKGFDSLGVSSYKKSLRTNSADIITKKSNYRELSNFYLKKGDFIKSGSYLDSIIQLMDGDSFVKKMTERERRGLDRIIVLEKKIRNNDSILSLVSMNQRDQLFFFNRHIQNSKKMDSFKKKKSKNKRGLLKRQSKSQVKFYFYNKDQLTEGKTSFLVLWGNLQNLDNWNSISKPISKLSNVNFKKDNNFKEKKFKAKTAMDFVSLLPRKTQTIDSLKKTRTQAYLDAGLLYKEKFVNEEMSIKRLTKVLRLDPNENQEVLALYNLYELYQTRDTVKAISFRESLIQKYPESVYTSEIVENPSFKKNKSPNNFYNSLYKKYILQDFLDIVENKNEYRKRLIGTGLELKLELLIINSIGRLRGVNDWQKQLEKFLEKYPNSKESLKVKKMLSDMKIKLIEKKTNEKKFKWIIVFPNSSEIDLYKLRVNMILELRKRSEVLKEISVDFYSDEYSFIVVHTENQYPEVKFLSKIWSDLSSFQNNLDNFVVLSSEYRQIQKQKTWKPNLN